jgi:hypothetical protein
LLRAGALTEVAVCASGRDDTPAVSLEAGCDRASDSPGPACDQRASVR